MFIAKTPNELPSMDELLAISGLDFMKAMQRGDISHPPITAALNYHLHLVEDGRVVFRGTPEFDHTNPMGTLHGGWYGTLLDSCMACAVMTRVPKGAVYTTLEYKVNITRAIPIGTQIIAEGAVSHAGRTTAVAGGTIRDAETGRLYATGTTTCLIMQGT